ncbi:MAG: hypothetical protein KY410_06295 [Proteobacteria bacterium]|nr:hypothetical protein [Pseudomonadota bacterium]
MNAASPVLPVTTVSRRAWLGPALLIATPLQFLLGDLILAAHPARPFNIVGAIGLLVVMTCTLTFIAGLGEIGKLLASRFFTGN